jgi:hypothetical protein
MTTLPDDPGQIAGVEGHYPTNVNQQPTIAVDAPIDAVTHDDDAGINAENDVVADDNANLPNPVTCEPNDAIIEPQPNDENAPVDTIIDNDAIGAQLADAIMDEVPDNEDVEGAMDQLYGERTTAYNLRPRKPRDYGHIHATLEHTDPAQHEE